MKAGDRFVSKMTGLGMVVQKVTKREITVEVERAVGRDALSMVRVHTRVVPVERWAVFASPYRSVTK